jgi:hypothetical protein
MTQNAISIRRQLFGVFTQKEIDWALVLDRAGLALVSFSAS